jgi:formylglycine-generating enzyme required for sulfatase activity
MDEKYNADPPGSDFGATTPNVRLPIAPKPDRPAMPPPGPTPPQKPAPRRRIPVWIWLVGGAGLLFLIVVVGIGLYIFIPREPGFTVIVRGAPPGSEVYVDNISRGVTSADGSIKVTGLKAGKRLLRVSHEGHSDFNTSVTGKDGDIKPIVAQLPGGVVKATLPNPIDYNGQMILIAAGEFVMGDDNHNPDERPAHKVTLPDFYIDKFEVTNEQYKKFCSETHPPCPTNPWWDDHYFNDHPRSPVLGVSADDALAYAKWAGKRLPTEEEWEKAASWDPGAQKKRQFPWGDTGDQSRANVGGTMRTADVGQFATDASAYGVQDMAGNVAEWVDGNYQPYPGNQTPDQNFGTQNRVVRGGTYRGDLKYSRTSSRLFHAPQLNESEKKNRAFLIGFRCGISADDPRLQDRLRAR